MACDSHVKWLRPENVSGGRNAVAEDCGQGTEKEHLSVCPVGANLVFVPLVFAPLCSPPSLKP